MAPTEKNRCKIKQIEGARTVNDGVTFSDISEKLIAQPLPLARSLEIEASTEKGKQSEREGAIRLQSMGGMRKIKTVECLRNKSFLTSAFIVLSD